MQLLENISKQELNQIKKTIGEAFISNELFHEFGDIQERKELVMKYIGLCVDSAYRSKALYATDNREAFIGLAYSDEEPLLPRIQLMFGILTAIPFPIMKKFLHHIKQISDSNKKYTAEPHVEILMVCVSPEYQGKGYVKQLVEFAKEKAAERRIPLLFDTDMERYAKIYQHYGCELYNQKTADNGVTRYSLVWRDYDSRRY